MEIARRHGNAKRGMRRAAEARERARRNAAQRGRVREWALGARDPEVELEVAELMYEGALTCDISLADQRARWEYLEAVWEAAGRPRGDADVARREIARALTRARDAA